MVVLNSAEGSDGSVDLAWEQYPNESNRITLGTKKDLFGDPLAEVTLDLKAEDKRTYQAALQLLSAMLAKTGYGTNLQPTTDPIVLSGDDAMGATRMQPAGPDAGVVDANCAVHDINNLYIAGSSVFPAGGWANPGLTVIALALRLADHLKTFPP
jgi:choline dehydrogenase-like flavoprotein